MHQVNHDMWEVATVDRPSGAVTPVTDRFGDHRITPDYVNSFLFQP